MSDNLLPSVEKPTETPERWKNLIIVLTILTTVFAAVLAALEADAGIRSSIANRDSQYYAVAASGELHRSGLSANYEFTVLGQILQNLQESTVFQLTALEQQGRGQADLAKTTLVLADAAQARTTEGNKFSIFYTDSRYAPQKDGEMPRMEAYLKDVQAKANELVSNQNRAADDYKRWSVKSDAYVTILTVLAVAFFMLGIGQAVKSNGLRLAFAVFGGLIILFCGAWTALILIG